MDIVFCDLETTGLDPARHTICEIGLIKGNETLDKFLELTPAEMKVADSAALKINRFFERRGPEGGLPYGEVLERGGMEYKDLRQELALSVAIMTDGCILAGNNVKFDQQFLEAWLRRHGACPTWDYHVLDVPTFAAGVLYACGVYIDPPYKSSKISSNLDILEPDEAHTALGDAQWAKRVYEVALERARDH